MPAVWLAALASPPAAITVCPGARPLAGDMLFPALTNVLLELLRRDDADTEVQPDKKVPLEHPEDDTEIESDEVLGVDYGRVEVVCGRLVRRRRDHREKLGQRRDTGRGEPLGELLGESSESSCDI